MTFERTLMIHRVVGAVAIAWTILSSERAAGEFQTRSINALAAARVTDRRALAV